MDQAGPQIGEQSTRVQTHRRRGAAKRRKPRHEPHKPNPERVAVNSAGLRQLPRAQYFVCTDSDRPKGAKYASPGQRPGYLRRTTPRALKGRPNRCLARLKVIAKRCRLLGRATPWVISMVRNTMPINRAETRHVCVTSPAWPLLQPIAVRAVSADSSQKNGQKWQRRASRAARLPASALRPGSPALRRLAGFAQRPRFAQTPRGAIA